MKYLSGPELFWACLFGVALFIEKLNHPPVRVINSWLESMYIIIPLLAGLLFVLFYVPGVEKSGLLIRIWFSSLLGGHFVLDRLLKAHSDQSPGIGMVYIVGMIFLLMVLVAGSIFIKLKWQQG